MLKKTYLLAFGFLICAGFIAYTEKAERTKSNVKHDFLVDTLVKNMIVPWEIVFLPDSTMLFTERSGRVRIYRHERLISKPALVIKDVDSTKKMGMLGMCPHPQFRSNKLIYIAYNYQKAGSPMLRVVRYQFANDSLVKPFIITDNIEANQNHTGCRVKFGPDAKLYVTTGDADRPVLAQDLKSLNGKILRLNDDGSIPADNPFTKNDTARKEIWTYGHRNSQGIAFQPGTNSLFNSEHGPSGGDEINLIVKGKNYGWPVIHHTESLAGMVSPLLEYTPSIGPAEAIFYNADAFPGMKGDLLVACLRGESVIRIKLNSQNIVSQQVILKQQYGRIRALAIGPDGYIYLSTSQNDPPEGKPKAGYDMILRLRPSPDTDYNFNAGMPAVNTENAGAIASTPVSLYKQLCASCHGADLRGTQTAKSLVDNKWEHGSGKKAIIKNISAGIPHKGMPAWQGALNAVQIEEIATYILTQQRNTDQRVPQYYR